MKPWHGIFFGVAIILFTNAIGIYGNPGGEPFAFFIPGIVFWSAISAFIISKMTKDKGTK